MKKTIYKYMSRSLPPTFRTGTNIDWHYEITIHDSYLIAEEDQADWNKLIGVKTNYFKPRENSLMVGWSWNPKKQMNDFAFYEHKDNKVYYTNSLGSVPLGKSIGWKANSRGNMVTQTLILPDYQSYPFQFTQVFDDDRFYLINTWFGGTNTKTGLNSVAPNNLNFDIVKIR